MMKVLWIRVRVDAGLYVSLVQLTGQDFDDVFDILC